MKKPYQPRNGKYERTNINITPERKRKAVRIGGSISGGIAKALDEYVDPTKYGYSPFNRWWRCECGFSMPDDGKKCLNCGRNAPESEKE